MSIPFPSNEWTLAFKDKLNGNPTYADVAKNWEGDMIFQVEWPDGRPPALLYMDLWHGQCRDAFEVTPDKTVTPAFRLTASLSNFIKVIKGELDPMQGMVTGKVKVQGNMVMMMKNIPTVLEFVKTAKQIETDFPV